MKTPDPKAVALAKEQLDAFPNVKLHIIEEVEVMSGKSFHNRIVQSTLVDGVEYTNSLIGGLNIVHPGAATDEEATIEIQLDERILLLSEKLTSALGRRTMPKMYLFRAGTRIDVRLLPSLGYNGLPFRVRVEFLGFEIHDDFVEWALKHPKVADVKQLGLS